jgi:hypothetical protein
MLSGTKTSSNATSQNSCVPSMNGIREIVSPAAAGSTMNWVSPAHRSTRR